MKWYLKNKEKISAKAKTNYASMTPEERRIWGFARHLGSRYKLTLVEYLTLVDKQMGACAICGAVKKLDIDHDHKTKKVRGLICRRCNLFVAFLETPYLLERSYRYLGQFQ